MRDKVQAQVNVGKAEALVRAAEAFLLQAVDSLWAEATSGQPISLEKRAVLRAATTFAGEAAADAVDLMHDTAGGTAIYETTPIEALLSATCMPRPST